MTQNELSLAVAMAQSNEELQTFVGEGSSQELNDLFLGYAMSDYKVTCITIRDLAALIRHECMQMNGELDTHQLNEIADIGKHKFSIVGLGDDDVVTELPHWFLEGQLV